MPATIRRQTRPDAETPFYKDENFKNYVLENWILTNKVILGQDISDDGLTATIYLEFVTFEVYEEWKNDPIVKAHKKTAREYNHAHGISGTTEFSD